MSDGRLRKGRYFETGGQNPFGVTPPAREHTVTFLDAVRRTRWIAIDISADRFSIFLLAPTPRRRALAPCFDSDYPALSAETRIIAMQGEQLARHVAVSTVPLWWSDMETHASLSALDWIRRTPPVTPGTTAAAFPVYAERGPAGLVVFSGASIAIDGAALFETHARCFALFEAVTRVATAERIGMPALSKRELDCLRLTADGHTSEEIAKLLGLAVNTTNQYLAHTTQKLNAVNRMHAVANALRLGLIE